MGKHINFERNPSILNDFIAYLLYSKNYSMNTIITYANRLKCFFKFIVEYKNLKIEFNKISLFNLLDIEEHDVIAFMVYSNYSQNNCSYSRQQRLSAIRTFYKWLLITNPQIQKENPAKNIPYPEATLRLPKYLSLEQAKRIQNIFTIQNSKLPIRNNAIITLFLSTGLRISELININVKDVNFDDNSIKILGKGNKHRVVYFSNYCKAKLLRYIEFRNKSDKNIKNDALFINLQHKRIGMDCVRTVCKEAYKLIGLEDCGYTVHTLRHTAATLMYKYNNRDITLVKEFLGHESMSSTAIYTHVYNADVKEAVENNPLNIL